VLLEVKNLLLFLLRSKTHELFSHCFEGNQQWTTQSGQQKIYWSKNDDVYDIIFDCEMNRSVDNQKSLACLYSIKVKHESATIAKLCWCRTRFIFLVIYTPLHSLMVIHLTRNYIVWLQQLHSAGRVPCCSAHNAAGGERAVVPSIKRPWDGLFECYWCYSRESDELAIIRLENWDNQVTELMSLLVICLFFFRLSFFICVAVLLS
jgi:hypothetical protein